MPDTKIFFFLCICSWTGRRISMEAVVGMEEKGKGFSCRSGISGEVPGTGASEYFEHWEISKPGTKMIF